MSHIPVRRTTRGTRGTSKDIENATARPSRVVTRSKTLAGTATGLSEVPATTTNITRAAAATTSSKAKSVDTADKDKVVMGDKAEKVAGKRKREALAEVTQHNRDKSKGGATMKGKGKEVGDVNSKTRLAPGKTARQPLKTVSSVQATATARRVAKVVGVKKVQVHVEVEEQDEEETPADDAIVVDQPEPTAAAARPAGRVSVFKFVPEPKEQASSRAVAPANYDENDAPRVFKKRHTLPKEEAVPVPAVVSAKADRAVVPRSGKKSIAVDESQVEEEKIAAQLANVIDDDDDDTGLWDDLDAEDWDDPAMCAEYVVEICCYMKELEMKLLPDLNYMDRHVELGWTERGILLDWIIQLHWRYQFLPESLFLFTNILDRFLSLRPQISVSKLQLVGLACFFIATKYEETLTPAVAEIARLSEDQYTVADILKAERYILNTLGYDLSYPGPMNWLRRGSKADDFEPQARTVAKYLLEVGCFEPKLVATPASLMAAAALWIARLTLGREDWSYNLSHYTGYKEREIIPTANLMLNYIAQPIVHESLFKKYAHKRFLKSSVYLREWTINRWGEGASIDLAASLADIKAEIMDAKISALEQEEYISDE